MWCSGKLSWCFLNNPDCTWKQVNTENWVLFFFNPPGSLDTCFCIFSGGGKNRLFVWDLFQPLEGVLVEMGYVCSPAMRRKCLTEVFLLTHPSSKDALNNAKPVLNSADLLEKERIRLFRNIVPTVWRTGALKHSENSTIHFLSAASQDFVGYQHSIKKTHTSCK